MDQTAAAHPLETCKPLGDRVVVRVDRVSETTRGGILLPEKAVRAERPQIGVVVAVGPGRRGRDGARIPVEVAVGRRVFFMGFSGARLDPEDYRGEDDFVMLREDDVLAELADD